jgi:hypothetical protein
VLAEIFHRRFDDEASVMIELAVAYQFSVQNVLPAFVVDFSTLLAGVFILRIKGDDLLFGFRRDIGPICVFGQRLFDQQSHAAISSRRLFCGRGPMWLITSAAARAPKRPHSSNVLAWVNIISGLIQVANSTSA